MKAIQALLLAIGLFSVASCVNAQKKADNPYNGKVIVMDDKMFREKVFDYVNNEEWKYVGDKPALIDFYADWCAPCRMMTPIIKEVAEEFGDSIYVYKIDVDKNEALAEYFDISSIPTFLFIPMKGQAYRLIGGNDKAYFVDMIRKVLLK